MTTTELIDRLCAVVEAQSGIIRKQAFFIEEQLAVDEATKNEFARQRESVDTQIDIIESSMSRLSALRKGDDYE